MNYITWLKERPTCQWEKKSIFLNWKYSADFAGLNRPIFGVSMLAMSQQKYIITMCLKIKQFSV